MDEFIASLCYYRDQLDNPLDDDAMVGTQLDQISTIARLVYGKTCALLVQLFDEVAGRYQEQIQQTTDAWQLIEGNWAPVYWTLGIFFVNICLVPSSEITVLFC